MAFRTTLNVLNVLESSIIVPKFSMFKMVENATDADTPTSEVLFTVSQTIQHVFQWISNAFISSLPIQVTELVFLVLV